MTSPRHACLFATAVAGLFLSAAVPAAAQGSDEERRACTPDVMRLCREYIPSVDRIVACLMDKREELNPDCRTVMFPAQPPAATIARQTPPTGKSAGRKPAATGAKAAAAKKPSTPMNLLPAADKPAAKKKTARPRDKQAQSAQ